MSKIKGLRECKPNVSSAGNKNSTCGKVHPTYSQGDGGCMRTETQNTLCYCPEKQDTPNLIHGSEFKIDKRYI